MNIKVEKHHDICDELNQIYEQKNHDYGDSFHKSWIEEGMAMPRIRLGDKFNRFKTLTLNANSQYSGKFNQYPTLNPSADEYNDAQRVKDESIRDTLLDLANYAIMTIMELDERRTDDNV